MLDRAQFIRPIAHRGLHDRNAGLIENSGPAFRAAIEAGRFAERSGEISDGWARGDLPAL